MGQKFHSSFMPETVAGPTKGGQVPGLVAASTIAGNNVMNFQESWSPTTGRLAPVAVTGQDLSAYAWWDGGGIAAPMVTNGRVTIHSLRFGPAQFAITGTGLDR